jgi:predicted enzyme related to lactoylglutathione lyase
MAVGKVYFMLDAVDMDRAVAFYRDGVGLSISFTSPDWSELTAAGATVALHGGGTSTEPRQTGLGFEVDSLEEAVEHAVAAGGSIVVPPADRAGEGILLAMVADPEGNIVSFAQPL